MPDRPPCKKCLLAELRESDLYESVQNQIALLPEDKRTEESLYRERLEHCKKCAKLLEGCCLLCGCYVEYRAAIAERHCPHEKHFW